MMRPGLRQTFTLTQAGNVLGVGRLTVRRLAKRGLIAYSRNPVSDRPYIERSELLRFLREHGYPDWAWKPYFQPPHGRLLVVRPAADVPVHKLSGCDPTICRSLIELGVWVGSYPAWGVVLDFDGLGRDAAVGAARELRAMVDHPLLIGVTGEDEASRPRNSVDLFDLMIPRPVNVQRLVKAINALRRSVLAKSPRIAEGGGGFRKLGRRRRRVT